MNRTLTVVALAGCWMSGCCGPAASDERAAHASGGALHVDLGRELFLPGDNRFAEGTAERIQAKLREARVASTTPLRVEVFGDDHPLTMHERTGSKLALSQHRAKALRDYLTGLGYRVDEAAGRGADVVDGRRPDRRAEIVVAGAE